MTSVNFISMMRQSIGIITDEGGATCHAAMCAQLNIPAIVGTKMHLKFTTRLFGDDGFNHGKIHSKNNYLLCQENQCLKVTYRLTIRLQFSRHNERELTEPTDGRYGSV